MPNSFGKLFTLTTWGESHGPAVGVVIDGCPPGLPLTAEEIQVELDRRRPGQSDIVTPRKEEDRVEILAGVFEGRTTGVPISLLVKNADQRPGAYDEMRDKFRPSHADFTYVSKFGLRDHRGGGRSSARETIGRVAAGAIAKKLLAHAGAAARAAVAPGVAGGTGAASGTEGNASLGTGATPSTAGQIGDLAYNQAAPTAAGGGVEIRAYITQVHDIAVPADALVEFPSLAAVEATAVRCPHPATAARMIERIKAVRSEGDSVGGVIECRVRGLPAGLGEPVFDRLEADLAKAMLSLPATKGFEIGSGFAGAQLRGSEHNDLFETRDGRVRTTTNRSGGVQGGISNGEDLIFRVAFKPTATILQPQKTVDVHGAETELMGRGRHDPCVVPRAVPIVEAMTALVLVDHWMRQAAQAGVFRF